MNPKRVEKKDVNIKNERKKWNFLVSFSFFPSMDEKNRKHE